MTTKKGFTLIELLIVIAIIGILASMLLVSLGSVRSSARDSRRIADIRQVQTALVLYFNQCSRYPGGPVTVASCVGTNPGGGSAGWTTLETNLGSSIPRDPVGGTATYEYAVTTAAPAGQSYTLKAVLENHNAVLDTNSDLDESLPTSWSTALVCGTAGP